MEKRVFKWAEPKNNENGGVKCLSCQTTTVGSVFHLKRHENSKTHKEKFRAASSTPSVAKILKDTQENSQDQKVREAELKLAMFQAEHNLSFNLIDRLPQLITSVCPDSKIALQLKIKIRKATQMLKMLIDPSNKDIIEDIRENDFSLILDEMTDISASKCPAVLARYYKNNKVLERFFALVEVENSTANGLFEAIKNIN